MENDEGTDEHLIDLDDYAITKMIFHTIIGDETNLRLSHTGYEYLKQAFESYEIPFPEDYHLTAGDLLLLNTRCSCPYYVASKAKFYAFFENEMAMHVRLVGGNLSLVI